MPGARQDGTSVTSPVYGGSQKSKAGSLREDKRIRSATMPHTEGGDTMSLVPLSNVTPSSPRTDITMSLAMSG
jgi:hypothetical protein